MAFTYVKENEIGLGYSSGVTCDYKPVYQFRIEENKRGGHDVYVTPVYYAWVNRGIEKNHNLSWGPDFSKREVREEILKELRNKIRDSFNVEC
jgi:hypothetical protein